MLTRANAERRLHDALQALFPKPRKDGVLHDNVQGGTIASDTAVDMLPVITYDVVAGEGNPVVGKRGRGGLRSITFNVNFVDIDREAAFACADKAFNGLRAWNPDYLAGGQPPGTTFYAAVLQLTIRG